MTKALTLDEARESALDEYGPRWLRVAEALARAVTEAVLAEHETARRKRLDDLKRGVGIPVYDDMVECEHCHGIGQPGGKLGGPEVGLCSWCGGLGRVARQEIAALSDGDRTRADDAGVGGAAEHIRSFTAFTSPDSARLTAAFARLRSMFLASQETPPDELATIAEALRSRDATIGDQARRIGEAGRLVEDARVELQMLLPAGIAGENVARWLDRALVLLALGALRRVPLTPGAGKDET